MKNGDRKEQLIQETFEKCLSGMDSLPSQRTEILRRMEDKTEERRQPRFRVPAVAAALMILLCVGITFISGQWGYVNHPDTIRPESRYTTQPIETALSGGTDEEGTGSASKDKNLFSWLNRELKYSWFGKLAGNYVINEAAERNNRGIPYIDGSYYDGETLVSVVAVPDTRIEEYEPDENELAHLTRLNKEPEILDWTGNDDSVVHEKWEECIRNKTPMGLIMYQYEPDSQLLDSDHHAIPSAGVFSMGWGFVEKGYTFYWMRYGEPLPDELRNRESLKVIHRVAETESIIYYDGEHYYSCSKYDKNHYVSADIPASRTEQRYYSGWGILDGTEMDIQGMVSGASAWIRVSDGGDEPGQREIILPAETKLTMVVQNENGKTLFRSSVFADYSCDEYCSVMLPLIWSERYEFNDSFLPEGRQTEQLPSSLRIYLIREHEEPWEGKEDEEPEPEIDPDSEPFAILTMDREGSNETPAFRETEAGGVSLKAGPAEYDGRTLAFGLSIENHNPESPVYCLVEEFSANGTDIDGAEGIQFGTCWIPSRWTEPAMQTTAHAIIPEEIRNADQIRIKVKVKTYRPLRPVYEVDERTDGFDPDIIQQKIGEGYYIIADGWGMIHYDPESKEWYDMIGEQEDEMGGVEEQELVLFFDLVKPEYGVLKTQKLYDDEHCTASYDVAAVETSGLHLTLRMIPKDDSCNQIRELALTDGEGVSLRGARFMPDVAVRVDVPDQKAVVYRYRWNNIRPQDLPDRISLSCTLESGEQMVFPVEVR